MDRITRAHLEHELKILVAKTGCPPEPWTRGEDGKYTANVGCIHLTQDGYGWQLVKMHNVHGGVSTIYRAATAREMYTFMRGTNWGMDPDGAA